MTVHTDALLTSLIYLVALFILLWLGKKLYDLTHRSFRLDEELVEKDNTALAVAMTGYYLGLVLAVGGAIAGPSHGIVEDLYDIVVFGLLALILMVLSGVVGDKIILRRFSNRKEIIEDQNAGAGVVEAGLSIATGLIIFGAIHGEGGTIWTALVFWIVGQIILIIASHVYNASTPYDIHREIERGNVAAGVGFAGALVAIGNVLRIGLGDDFVAWGPSLLAVILFSALGLILLPIVRYLTDKVLLPGASLSAEIAEQERPNLGAAFIEAFSYVGASFLIGWCL